MVFFGRFLAVLEWKPIDRLEDAWKILTSICVREDTFELKQQN